MKKLLWIPRLLILGLAIFLGAFSFDPIEDMFILLIPTYILLFVLLLSWKSPKLGAALSLITAVLFTLVLHTYEYYLSFLSISLPLILACIFYVIHIIFTSGD